MLATSGMPADAGAAPRLDVVFQSAASQVPVLHHIVFIVQGLVTFNHVSVLMVLMC